MASNQIHVPGASRPFDLSDVCIVIAVSSPAGPVLIVILKNGDQVYIWDTVEAREILRAAGLKIHTIKSGVSSPEPEEIPTIEEGYAPPVPGGGFKI